ncbi:MAG: V-type ATP synthase subunit I [Theionarchaea archaeon]|nr:V-type ATP synthase subunit I [Theionarchaea archaeon]MBU6999755.1 V-type ATP synthase subunit I [Theionarchaea archaeon]MBU7020176.1 V-type ATP synthase subunit I [Theionarchaea archaeon]MBU7033707.1 V-type ATP synthase subunit I [Theionarchaea archaeon]MBU7039982.1 V-type ATP synthase subunit I [Theionarchaea archaeon]
MPIPKMQKVHIVAHADHKDAIIEKLHDAGLVEVETFTEILEGLHTEDVDAGDLERKLADLSYGIDFLYTFSVKPNLLESFFLPRYKIEKKHYEAVVNEFDFSIIEEMKNLDQTLSELKNEETRLKSIIEQLQPWETLTIAVRDFETERTVTEVGIISTEAVSEILKLEYVHVEIPFSTERKTWMSVTYLKDYRDELEEIFRKLDFQKVSLPGGSEGTPAETIEEAGHQIQMLQKEREKVRERCMVLAERRMHLMIVYDHYLDIKKRHDVRKDFANTEKSFILQGWIRKEDLPVLRKELSFADEVDISSYEPSDIDDVPVGIENRRAFKPFEVITRIYGLPLYKEIDPTLLLAPFFIVFFGLCLSDFLYGAALILLSVFALKKIKVGPDAVLLFKVLIMGGVVTMVLGILTGGWAGDLTLYLPEQLSFLENVRQSLTVINLLENPILMLEIALILGLVQVWAGILIRGYMNVRDGYYLDAIFDQGLWLLLLPAGTLALINKMFGVDVPAAGLMLNLSLAALVGLVLTQGRYQKASNPVVALGKKAMVGVLSIYNIFGYLGDVLSYSRILALGLATAALASAFNMVAVQASGIKILGPIIMVMFLILLHLLNIVISSLSAFVHSGRLQFVEYFTKFLEGGGRTFKPFGSHPKYIQIKEED